MISTREAFSILNNHSLALSIEKKPLWDARNHAIAEDVYAPINMPPFAQSAMDGVAVCLHDTLDYAIVGETKAGDAPFSQTLLPGQALRIFTGSSIPKGAQAIVPIEQYKRQGDTVFLKTKPTLNQHIRPIAEQFKKGDKTIEKGSYLNAAAIGLLSGLGIASVRVYKIPSVAIITTGNELAHLGAPLAPGKVYESNGLMLRLALDEMHITDVEIFAVEDDLDGLKKTLQAALLSKDAILMSGGISAGDYDFAFKALQEEQVTPLFYKINQKPGKPLFAGWREDKIVFALPGNPASCLSCFHIYAKPTLKKMAGRKVYFASNVRMPLSSDLSVDNAREQFMQAVATDNAVSLLPHQNSAALGSFSKANCLVYLPAGKYTLHKNDTAEIYPL